MFGNSRRSGAALTSSSPVRTASPAPAFGSGALAGVSSGRPAALSSAQIIAQHKQRELAAAQEAAGGSAEDTDAGDLLARLVAYFTGRQGHSATSDEVLAAFEAEAGQRHGALLKQSLKQVATLHRQPGAAKWVLKDDFL